MLWSGCWFLKVVRRVCKRGRIRIIAKSSVWRLAKLYRWVKLDKFILMVWIGFCVIIIVVLCFGFGIIFIIMCWWWVICVLVWAVLCLSLITANRLNFLSSLWLYNYYWVLSYFLSYFVILWKICSCFWLSFFWKILKLILKVSVTIGKASCCCFFWTSIVWRLWLFLWNCCSWLLVKLCEMCLVILYILIMFFWVWEMCRVFC